MGRAACSYGVTQRPRDMILSDNFVECLRSEAAIQRHICHLWFPLTLTYGLLVTPSDSCRGHCLGLDIQFSIDLVCPQYEAGEEKTGP